MTTLANIRSSYSILLLLLLLFGVSFADSLKTIVGWWFEGDEAINRTGAVIVGCSVYLLYVKKDLFQQINTKPFNLGIAVLFLGTILWLLGRVVDVQTLYLGIIPVILMGLSLSCLGWNGFKLTFFPLLLIFFAIPIWWPLTPYLQDIATVVSKLVLNTINKPVFVEGNILHLPGGSFFIDESCAGLRFLVVTFTLCFFCFDLFRLSPVNGSVLVVAGLVLALIANWIRILIVVLIGDATQMQSGLVNDHFTLGWIVYSFVVLMPVYFLSSVLSLQFTDANKEGEERAQTKRQYNSSAFPIGYILICALLLVYAPVVNYFIGNRAESSVQIHPPEQAGRWRLNQIDDMRSAGDWQPAYLNESSYLKAEYTRDTVNIDLHLVQYNNQRQNEEVINLENELADDVDWSVQSGSNAVAQVRGNSDTILIFNSSIVSNTLNERKLVWYRFDIGGRGTHSTTTAKLFQLMSLFTNRTDGTLIAISTNCQLTCSAAKDNLEQFVSDLQRNAPDFF